MMQVGAKHIYLTDCEGSTGSLAWLIWDQTIFVAKSSEGFAGQASKSPLSPVVNLLVGVAQYFGDQSLRVLRQRIYANYLLTPICQAAVQLGAKRVSVKVGTTPSFAERHVIDVTETALAAWFIRGEVYSSDVLQPWEFTDQLLGLIERPTQRWQAARPVACCCKIPGSIALLGGINTNAAIKIQHAEMNMLVSMWKANLLPLPSGTKIYTTLKPCRLCAAALVQCSTDSKSIAVTYSSDDGPLAQNTLLDHLGVVVAREQ